MGDKSGIEWTDATWNPVTGCSHESEGCRHCYAETMAKRLHAMGQPGYTDLPWTAQNAAVNVQCHADRLAMPLRWTRPRMIFVNSMSDLFHPNVPFEFVDRMLAVMALAQRHTFQVLTKRAERMAQYFASCVTDDGHLHPRFRDVLTEVQGHVIDGLDRLILTSRGWPWPLPNVWLGVSVEDQKAADKRIPHLLLTPAAVRFLSCEPLLGLVDLSRHIEQCSACGEAPGLDSRWRFNGRRWEHHHGYPAGHIETEIRPDSIHWVIAGGESGANARPMHPDWARTLRDQCQAAHVAFHFKQWGAYRPTEETVMHPHQDYAFPFGDANKERVVLNGLQAARMERVGKKAAGRLLDGRTWDEFPQANEVQA